MDVKIGSKAIAKRLENVLPSIIHYNQCAYLKGRTIFDAVRTVDDIMEFSERYNLEGRMICIDFNKAFDTVSRDFLFRTLSSFGFGPSFLRWIHTFYNNISSCVVNNDFSTQHFTVERGVRQGDPLSAYLFIIVLEILCISLRNSKNIHGIKVDEEEIRLCLFADDLTGFFFIVPIFLYRPSLISVNKEFVKDVNKIIFDFIWKGKDKVKRSALTSDIEDGGLKAPHLESIIETQRVLCCKKLASNQPSNWKNIILHYLEPVGGKFIFCCDFDLKKLPVKLPAFYEECLKSFVKCSAANRTSLQDQNEQDLSKAIVWNNKFICVGGRSVYFGNLAGKGILRMGDLISDNNQFIVKSNHKLRELNISPLDFFRLTSVIDAIPAEWREWLTTSAPIVGNEPFNLHDEIKKCFIRNSGFKDSL